MHNARSAPSLCVIATMPGRPLRAALQSIRPQVDLLCLVLNGFEGYPPEVSDFDCDAILYRHNRGAEAKMVYAQDWRGYLLTCDDDLAYPPDYVTRLTEAVEWWDRRALVGVLGRRYSGPVTSWTRSAVRWPHHTPHPRGEWVNLLGTGTLCYHAGSLSLPATWPMRNCLDAQVAAWAQRHRVPMWMVSRPRNWLTVLQPPGPGSVFVEDRRQGFTLRNQVMRSISAWHLYTLPGPPPPPRRVPSGPAQSVSYATSRRAPSPPPPDTLRARAHLVPMTTAAPGALRASRTAVETTTDPGRPASDASEPV